MSDLEAEINKLNAKIQNAHLPPGLTQKCFGFTKRLASIAKFGGFANEYEKIAHYINWVTSLPWTTSSQDNLDLKHAKQALDQNHYDLKEVKERILEYISVLKLTQTNTGSSISKAPILCFIGLVGTGKTTLAKSIAIALNRRYARIPFGGMGSALDLRGQSRLHPDAEPGQIIKALRSTQTNNPIILLDEIDRTTEKARPDIHGVLIELLDPEQNKNFTDHYIDYPFDLSKTLFIITANTTRHLSPAVLDRLEVIQMPSYSDKQKIAIARNYIFPKTIKSNGLTTNDIIIQENVWPKIVRPLGFDAGIRSLARTIESLCRKRAKEKVEGKTEALIITLQNYQNYIEAY